MPPKQQQQQHAQPQKQPPQQQQQYIPLKKRRPKIQAEMEAAAAARELSPQDIYYDPRYKSYFYAGTMPPTPAEDASQASAGASEIQVSTHDYGMERRSILSMRRVVAEH
ncbi:hypothetical protein V5799_007430 [Amblyomma americanum]|uniref:Uncharacterized protein n=1 Tax=Amblyomma americanum TaxID=6943 RepID=A0AAQ4FHY0_AMBAM